MFLYSFVLKINIEKNVYYFTVANRGDYREKNACPLTKKVQKSKNNCVDFYIHPTPDSILMNEMLKIFAGNEINENAHALDLKVG